MNKIRSIPFLYHPTRVLALDDEPDHLKTMQRLIHRSIPRILSDEPATALECLRMCSYKRDALGSLLSELDEGMLSSQAYNLNLSNIYSMMKTPDRFEKIAVAFIDQSMSKMDGLVFCREVRKENLAVQLVLLTGNAGVKEAISAFNEGIIDAYLPKSHPELRRMVNEHIISYNWQQFVQLSMNLSGLMTHASLLLDDPHFVDFFEKIWLEQGHSEFYLVDSSCSFLFVNEQGDVSLLFVRSESDFEEVHELAQHSGASDNVLEAIQARKKIPLAFENDHYLRLEGEKWQDALVSVEKIPGCNRYYVLIAQPNMVAFSLKRYFTEIL